MDRLGFLDACERCGEPESWHPFPLRTPPTRGWRLLRWLLGFHPYQAAHVVRLARGGA